MSTKNGQPLRAVGYCRTSGEGQRDNTSIPRQRAAIEVTCQANGWRFLRHYVDECRSGAKTEGREAFQQMLLDAAAGGFDVLVPFDATRLARDGVDILSTAKVLKGSFGILTVDAKAQFDNRHHHNALRNFVHAGVSEWERLSIMERLIGGKIKRAKDDNVPTSGRLPVGRTFDRAAGKWGIDPGKAAMIRDVAERYLAGESLWKLAEEYRVSYNRLWRNLRHECGDVWTLTYRVPELGIEETVNHAVPRLLPEPTIRAVRQRMDANRTYLHGRPKHDYLLGGRVFCAECGRLMTGAIKPGGIRHYRHNARNNPCSLRPRPSVRADLLERAVLMDLFNMLGNPGAIERATRAAVPDCDKLLKQRQRIETEVAKIGKARDRLLDLIENDALTDKQAERKLKELKEREATLRAESEKLSAVLADIPDADAVRCYVERIGDSILILDEEWNHYIGGNDVQSWVTMTTETREDLPKLIETAFGLPMPDGSPAGVYVSPDTGAYHRPKRFTYAIRGRLLPSKKGATQSRSYDRT